MNAMAGEKRNFLVGAAEQHRVAALEAHHDAIAARGVQQALVDEVLRGRMAPAALAHGDFLRARREGQDLAADQRVVEHTVRLGQQPGGAHGLLVGRAGAGTDQVDLHAVRRRNNGTGLATEAW